MRVYLADDYKSMSRKVANIISAQVIINPDSVLGLATGSTPKGTYNQLVEWYNKGDLSFSHIKTVNLDEYVGLSPEHEQSYRYFMQHNLFNHVNIKATNTNLPNGLSDNLCQECKGYDTLIEALGGIDLLLLGIGHNGHIGFNEPESAFELGTHVIELSKKTLSANARFFDGDIDKVPTHAITLGIKNIMHAKKIVVALSGEDKSDIIVTALTGPVTPSIPASILQLHPNVSIVGDRAALSKLLKYDEVFTHWENL